LTPKALAKVSRPLVVGFCLLLGYAPAALFRYGALLPSRTPFPLEPSTLALLVAIALGAVIVVHVRRVRRGVEGSGAAWALVSIGVLAGALLALLLSPIPQYSRGYRGAIHLTLQAPIQQAFDGPAQCSTEPGTDRVIAVGSYSVGTAGGVDLSIGVDMSQSPPSVNVATYLTRLESSVAVHSRGNTGDATFSGLRSQEVFIGGQQHGPDVAGSLTWSCSGERLPDDIEEPAG